MTKITYPTDISLKEIPPEGRDFYYTNETGELSQGLKDLIQSNPYQVELHLRPLGNAFEITGKIRTQMDLLCSRCGREIQHPISDDFRELIMVEDERPRGGHAGHTGGHLLSEGPYCNFIPSPYLNVIDFIHEHVAASEPYIIECRRGDCEAEMRKAQLGAMAPADFDENTNPFAALKNLKVP